MQRMVGGRFSGMVDFQIRARRIPRRATPQVYRIRINKNDSVDRAFARTFFRLDECAIVSTRRVASATNVSQSSFGNRVSKLTRRLSWPHKPVRKARPAVSEKTLKAIWRRDFCAS